MKATRLDVAKLAGVSTATVSNVMNHSRAVREETVQKVLAAMEELHYQPNLLAQSLSTNRTMQIGLVLENIQNPYYGEVVEYFEEAARQHGYFINICFGTDNLDGYFDNFVRRSLDGVYIAALPTQFSSEKIEMLLENRIALVISGNRNFSDTRVSSLEHDYPTAIRDALAYLTSLGHREIVFLSGLGEEYHADLRLSGYISEMKARGLFPRYLAGKPPYPTTAQVGYDLATRLLNEDPLPFTALLCGNDLIAIGAMHALQEKGISIPADVSVMGFDDIALGQYQTPSLTTMSVNVSRFGKKAFDLLLDQMLTGTVANYENKLELTVRKSTGLCTQKYNI